MNRYRFAIKWLGLLLKKISKPSLTLDQAYSLVSKKNLPEDFDNWKLADDTGWSVAHQAALFGALPETFDLWGLADHRGVTVAHVAATANSLPAGFDQWELADDAGHTVRDFAYFTGSQGAKRMVSHV